MPPNDQQPNNSLHGVTLIAMLEHLVDVYGWEEMGYRIDIRCFNEDPSINSSLKFLRTTPWARAKVERLYVRSLRHSRPQEVHRPRTPESEVTPTDPEET